MAVIIGNGETRINFDLSKLSKQVTYGCNGLHRDYNLTYLFACDRKMVEEIVDYSKTVYTRKKWFNSFKDYTFVKYFIDLSYKGSLKQDNCDNWGAGSYAILHACSREKDDLYLMGFDMYSKNKLHNNIYKNTKNYQSNLYRAVDPSFWIYQIEKLINLYSNNFIFVYPKGWNYTPWKSKNVHYINYKEFKNILQNT